jgi:hypothetical protein
MTWIQCSARNTGEKAYLLFNRIGDRRAYIVWDNIEGKYLCQIDRVLLAKFDTIEKCKRYFKREPIILLESERRL